ncbi:sensor histidine kinase [Kordiimonas marina]|uniref:sensor histidine kinase n=1 Tax=Kordiimonas marina TaxID=2872312 RepID=UPI001FF3B972|nr:PAS domain-containing hybrid sensor histidine kinase/response regulator [Kordiimonas marina]MCJ9430176.1 PAS domain-containing protein [Kordiimonas marina]
MDAQSSKNGGKVVDLADRRGETAEGAFGASISRGARHRAPANEQVLGLVARILVDESLPFYVATLDGTVIHVNDHYSTLDKNLGDITLAPGEAKMAGQHQVPSLKPVIEDVLASETTVRAEEIVAIKGRERIFLGRHTPVRNERGDIVAVAGTYEDVTVQVRGIEEANRTQARFQDFARASSDWFFECDADMRIRSLSERFTAIVGQPASLFIGSKFEQFGRFEENLEGRMDGPQSIRAKKPFREQLFVISEPSGGELMFHLSAVPVFDRQSGDFRGYRGVGMDVTVRYKQADEAADIRKNLETLLKELTRKNMALDEATEQATTALRAKNEFLAAMSHELRTPLNAIIGFAEAFEQETFGRLEGAYQSYATDIRKSGQHLLGLINDILDVAVIESGGLSLQVDDLSLEQVISKAVHMNMDAAHKKGLDTKALAVTSDLWVRADDRRTTQIFVNLLSNAIKFTPEGGQIGIEISHKPDDAQVQVTVWDTGIGISEEHQGAVFVKFHQVTEHIYSRKQEGTGLGLHISRELARKMEGDILLESAEGEGSRFTVLLPVADGSALEGDFI